MAEPDLDNTTLTHFYRAVVGHADVWRLRMDATNWAAATTGQGGGMTRGVAEGTAGPSRYRGPTRWK